MQCCVCTHWLGYEDLMMGKCRVTHQVTGATYVCSNFDAKEKKNHCTTCGTKLSEVDYGLPANTVFLFCKTCKEER